MAVGALAGSPRCMGQSWWWVQLWGPSGFCYQQITIMAWQHAYISLSSDGFWQTETLLRFLDADPKEASGKDKTCTVNTVWSSSGSPFTNSSLSHSRRAAQPCCCPCCCPSAAPWLLMSSCRLCLCCKRNVEYIIITDFKRELGCGLEILPPPDPVLVLALNSVLSLIFTKWLWVNPWPKPVCSGDL